MKGRIENIFTDELYSQFAAEITRMLRLWKPKLLPSGIINLMFCIQTDFFYSSVCPSVAFCSLSAHCFFTALVLSHCFHQRSSDKSTFSPHHSLTPLFPCPLLLPQGAAVSSRVVESYLWECKQLGAYSPIVLLNTLLFFCTKTFRFRTLAQHQSLSFANFTRCSKPCNRAGKVHYLRYHRRIRAAPYREETGGYSYSRYKYFC